MSITETVVAPAFVTHISLVFGRKRALLGFAPTVMVVTNPVTFSEVFPVTPDTGSVATTLVTPPVDELVNLPVGSTVPTALLERDQVTWAVRSFVVPSL